MHLQPITYRGRLAAAATRTRFFLSDELEASTDDGEIRMVTFMCLYAVDVATGVLPGPYTDDQARRYARYCLLAPGAAELLERPDLNVARAARALRIPADELRVAIAEHRENARADAANR